MKKILLSVILFATVLFALVYVDVIWTSPKFYKVTAAPVLQAPIMSMEEYDAINDHVRPYIYQVTSASGGSVTVVGIEHTRDPHDAQLDTIRALWRAGNPTVALVEGRLGFLFSWLQDPVAEHGEGGLVAALAKDSNADLYTWEPSRDEELKLMVKKYPKEQLAMFYALRPYFSNVRHGRPENPEEKLQEYINDRTDYDLIRGSVSTWQQIDSRWKKDFPNEKDWRDFSDEYGWPKGYLFEIWNDSNLTRDLHLCHAIADLVAKKENVFVTMGSSHAPRIEAALKSPVKVDQAFFDDAF